MLVLSRKAKEQIMIGDEVRITLLRIDGNKVRIGIDAPKHVRVIRGELHPEPEPSDPVDGQGQLSDREHAFAHPQRISKPVSVSGSGSLAPASPSMALPTRRPQRPRRAPLSDFMTAG